MSQRPQPVTSKFRSYYTNDIYPVYFNSNKSSSAGSTSSLTSILHHDSFDETCSFSDNSLQVEKTNQIINEEALAPPASSFCKRIIARQPHYPGERITITKYNSVMDKSLQKECSLNKKRVLKSSKSTIKTSQLNNVELSQQKKIIRKVANKSRSVSEHSDKMKKSIDDKSEDSYSCNDFSSVSEVNTDNKTPVNNLIDNDICSSIDANLSVGIDDPLGNDKEDITKKEKSHKILTAWEAWYLKKEKQKRKKEEIELLKEKEKNEKEVEDKTKKTEICQEKIKDWLIKKEKTQRKELEMIRKRIEKEKHLKEQKKEEMIKKSSEKYIQWKMEKKKREKELEKQELESKIKLEADKMIKQAKAANAFGRWFEEHKDHQSTVPYSYGISDGKLTSYYDKTSNPPPSFFNPDPWKSVIDIKKLIL